MASAVEPVPSALEDQYFSSNPPPKALPQHVALAQAFIDFHAAANRRVVLVTSGGTTVPLEKQTVRFIDNFSAGTRGATSAEYFLESGYAVIFLHRQFSLLPYSRHYSHATDCFLDFLHEGPGGTVVAKPAYSDTMLSVLRKYQAARADNLLLTVPFVTIGDYLHELRAIARLMHRLGPDGLLYLAAAASDFFLPQDRMAEHKIQSTDVADKAKKAAAPAADEEFDNFDSSPQIPRSKRLIVDLDPVPKFLKNLVDGWAPQCMIVSFKLETDPGESTAPTLPPPTGAPIQTEISRPYPFPLYPSSWVADHLSQRSWSSKPRRLWSGTAITWSSATCCPRASGRSSSSRQAGPTSGSAYPAPRRSRPPATRGRSARWRAASTPGTPGMPRTTSLWTPARCPRAIPTRRSRA